MLTWEQREQELSEKLHYIEILGELNIPEEWVTQFRGFITCQFQHQDPAHVLRAFIKHYPVCLATYLVLQGVYSYQEGNYWSHVIDEYELAPNHTHLLGDFFRDFLHQHNLSSFASVEGHKFVSVILLHGGIPNYSLHDFFEYVLAPALSRPHIYGEDGAEIIANWLGRKHQSSVDKPITRFLQYPTRCATSSTSQNPACEYPFSLCCVRRQRYFCALPRKKREHGPSLWSHFSKSCISLRNPWEYGGKLAADFVEGCASIFCRGK